MFLDKFRETVFLKTDSELEKRLEILQILKNKFPDNKKINEEFWAVRRGLKGEEKIAYELKHTDIGMYVLHDITLEVERRYSPNRLQHYYTSVFLFC